jgi:cytochrome c553
MKVLSMILSLGFVGAAYAQDVKNGANLYKKCIACHGNDGYGKASQKAPMVAGQFAWYVEAQIKAIQTGERDNKNARKMVPFVKNLTANEIKDLSAYISSLPLKK